MTDPCSKILPENENRTRQQSLEADIRDLNLVFINAASGGGDTWPLEKMILILNMSLEKAREIGKKFDQYALVYIKTLYMYDDSNRRLHLPLLVTL